MPVGARRAKVELTADPSKLDPGLKQARSKLAAFGKAADRGVRRVAKGAFFGVAGAAAGAVAAGAGLFGSQVDDALDYERQIARLAIAQGKANEQMGAFKQALTDASIETGLNRNEILRGVAAYQALTGDTEGATAASRTFARVAQATGSTVEDVARSAQGLRDNLKIDARDFEKMFSILNVQGKAGSVELNEFAREVAALSANFKQFQGGTGIAGATELGAAFQTVRKDVGSSSEAATRLLALSTSITRKAEKLRKKGIRVFDAKGERRNFTEILQDFRRVKLGETDKIKILGSSEAVQALNALTAHWEDFRGLVQTTDFGSIDRDLKQFGESAAGKLEQAMNRLKLAAAEAFTPERIKGFADAIERILPAVEKAASAIGWIVDKLDTTRTDAGKSMDRRQKELKAQGLDDVQAARQAMHEHNRMRSLGEAAAQGAAANTESQRLVREVQKLNQLLTNQKVEATLKVDGNAIATATANAPRARQRP